MPCLAQLEEKVVLRSLNDLNPLASLQPDPVADGKGTEAPCFTRSGLCPTTGAELPAPGPGGGPGRAERAQHPGTPHAAAGPHSSAEVCSSSWSGEAVLLERGLCSCSVLQGVLGRQRPWQEGLVRAGRGGGLGTWPRAENGSCQEPDSPEHGAQRGGAHTGLVQVWPHLSVLGQLGKTRQQSRSLHRPGRRQQDNYRTVCSQEDPRPWAQRKAGTRKGRVSRSELEGGLGLRSTRSAISAGFGSQQSCFQVA